MQPTSLPKSLGVVNRRTNHGSTVGGADEEANGCCFGFEFEAEADIVRRFLFQRRVKVPSLSMFLAYIYISALYAGSAYAPYWHPLIHRCNCNACSRANK